MGMSPSPVGTTAGLEAESPFHWKVYGARGSREGWGCQLERSLLTSRAHTGGDSAGSMVSDPSLDAAVFKKYCIIIIIISISYFCVFFFSISLGIGVGREEEEKVSFVC